jgi:ABC-type lipoprotein release transport system permease subunit
MTRKSLLINNLRHYWRANLAVVLGVAVAVSVLSGALLVGASVRGSLRDILLERIGKTEYVVSGQNFFRAQLAADIQATQQFNAVPLIALTGTIENAQSQRRGAGVLVYGVDERFWQFHGKEFAAPQGREILLSEALARELQPQAGETLLLRVEKPSAIPVESLHGRKDDLGKTLRLDFRGVTPANAMGDFSLRPTQAAARAVFVPLSLLQKELEQAGRVNALLIAGGRQPAAGSLNALIKEKFTLEDVGVKIRPLAAFKGFAVQSESGLLNDYLAKTTKNTAAKLGWKTEEALSYLANSIRHNGREIPYSLVSAVDNEKAGLESKPPGKVIYLNEWARKELNLPDNGWGWVDLDYYLWQEDGRLITKTERFGFGGNGPLGVFDADPALIPDYPGLTEADSMDEWNPPFPVDLKKIRPQDEAYWKQYRVTPKAFIWLGEAQKLWGSRFGKATAVKITQPEGVSSQTFAAQLKANLDPTIMGLTVMPVKADGLQAARGTTDFGEYFLYFSFFLVVSALLLAALFFRFGVEQRAREIGLLQAVGFPLAAIRGLFLREGLLLATAGSLLGVAGAVLYAKLIVYGLNNWWSGAVGTSKLSLAVSPLALGIGFAAGILAALACVALTLRGLARQSARGLLAGVLSPAFRRPGADGKKPPKGGTQNPAALFGVLGITLLVAASFKIIGPAAGFFGGGATLLIAALTALSWWLKRGGHKTIGGPGIWPLALLGARNVTRRPGRSVLCVSLIAAAAFIVVTVGAFRKDGKQDVYDRKAGNGGYPLLAESQLPLLRNPNTPEGREELNLTDAPNVNFTRFRVRPGDDASCLNLFQAQNPRVIAPADDFLNQNRFAFSSVLTPAENPWKLLEQDQTDGATPVIADANSLAYALHLSVGDTFTLPRANGEPVRLRIVGALSDSIFQGEFVMAEKNFLRLFPEQQGFRFFLLDAPPESVGVLEERLSDYGFDARPANERLAEFHRVENTYLSTFQMLGALGLALGTLGLGAILLRNALERRRELALLKALGYGPRHFALMSLAENGFLLFAGLLTGTLCALLAIVPVILARGGGLPFKSVLGLLALVTLCGLGASWLATRITLRSPLLQSLRSE